MNKHTIEIPFLGGTVAVGYEQAENTVTVYGDPQGLRAMGSLSFVYSRHGSVKA